MAAAKIRSVLQLYEAIPEDQRILVDVLRSVVTSSLPAYCKEKISFNVPYFYGNKGICIIWPAAIPRGGIKKGVLFGFWYGNRLNDKAGYLTHGSNKQIFYKIYHHPDEIDIKKLVALLREAIVLDQQWIRK